MFLFNDKRDEYTVYSIQDLALDKEASDIEKYTEDLDTNHLVFEVGSSPVAFICRPLSFKAQRDLTKIYTSGADIEKDTNSHFEIAQLSFLASVVRIETDQELPAELIGLLAKGRVDGALNERVIDFFDPLIVMDVGGRCGMASVTGKKK